MNDSEFLKNYTNNRLNIDVERAVCNRGVAMDVLWLIINDVSDSFAERTDAFFTLFKEMLRRGHLKLQRDGKIIEHTPEEWEAIFRAVWPEYEEEPNPLPGYAPFTIDMWLTVEAPAFAVWVDPDDGTLEWAT